MTRVTLLVFALTFVPRVLQADPIVNGNFNTGLLGWTATPGVSVVSSQAFIPNFGLNNIVDLLHISSGFALQDFATSLLGSSGGGVPVTASGMAQSFTANAGDVLSFNWNYLTDETHISVPPPLQLPDFSLLVLDGEMIALGTALQATLDASSRGFHTQSGTQTFSRMLTMTGTHTIGFGVFNTFDGDVASGMFVDNVSVAPVPEPSTLLLMLVPGLALLIWRRFA